MIPKQITIPCLGYSIAADWYENTSRKEILLTFVGYGSTKARNAEFNADILRRTGMSGLLVDLSGHGESPFELHDTKPAQHLLEVSIVFDWLSAEYHDAKINVMGTSYGGYMAAWLTRFRNFEKLILRTPALYKPEDFYTPHCLINKSDELAAYRKNTALIERNPLFLQDSIFNGETLLVIHGEDEDIPTETSDLYRRDFRAEIYFAAGFRHGYRDPRNPQAGLEPYNAAIASWLNVDK